MLHIKVDGMLSGTGIRDAEKGGYLEPNEIGVSASLQTKITNWLSHYENAHYNDYNDLSEVENLDKEGIEICNLLKADIPTCKVEYFSSAKMENIPF